MAVLLVIPYLSVLKRATSSSRVARTSSIGRPFVRRSRKKVGIHYGALAELVVNAMTEVKPGFVDFELALMACTSAGVMR